MATWLIYPPFADPTQPYLALPYLKAALNKKGLDARVLDLNVAAAHYLIDPDAMKAYAETIALRFETLNGKKKLSPLEALEYVDLADARIPARRLVATDIPPQKIFQDKGLFYDFELYRKARNLTEHAFTCISAACFPVQFHFNRATYLGVPWSPDLLKRYFLNRESPLDAFYRSFLEKLSIEDRDVVGINLTFTSQIPETFYIAQLIRRMHPSVFIVLGGSCLQQMLTHGTETARKFVVTVADAACPFEGEETFPLLIKALNKDNAINDPNIRYK